MSESPRIAVISGSPQLLTRSSHSLYQYVLFSVAETVKTCRGRGGGTLWRLLPGSGWRSPTRDAGRRREEEPTGDAGSVGGVRGRPPAGHRGGGSGGVGADGRGGRRGPELAAGVQVEGVYGGGGYLGGDAGGAVHADADPVAHEVDGADLAWPDVWRGFAVGAVPAHRDVVGHDEREDLPGHLLAG